MDKYVLYMHKNKTNGKIYIGITNNVKGRWRGEGSQYKPHKTRNQNIPFWNAIQKYGFDNFEHIILRENLTSEEACKLEVEYIARYGSTEKDKGYNRAIGGNGGIIYKEHPKGMKGKKQTDFQKENHREWASNKENNCMTNGKVVWGETHEHPKGMKGKKHTKEHKEKVSEFMRTQHPNFKKCYLVYPNGETKEFKSPKFLCEFINIGRTSSIYKTMKIQPYKVTKNSNPKRYDLEGLMIIFENNQVNTEVN